MPTYLWIALGGALGSVGRAWTATAVARLTGPAFPWGTVMINILGSFIIGFFGTLTASSDRFPVPADIRAFVMVGICGGFTTFSSFSLQTLELARDGRPLQALGNVMLSVLCCLLAVSAGHYGAAAIPRAPAAHAAIEGGPSMGEVAVAVLDRPEDAPHILAAAGAAIGLGGGGRIEALAVRQPPLAAILPSEEVMTATQEAAHRAQWEDWAGQLRRLADRWTPPPGVTLDFLDLEGDAPSLVTDFGRRTDLVVLSRPQPHDTERARDCLHAALFDTECPVLVVPPGFTGPIGQVAAIAWQDDGRAERAVRAAWPLLARAGAVHVLHAGPPPAMPAVLREHGIAAQLHAVPDGEAPLAARLLAAAHRLGADLLVMGAFSHRAWRERLFGGVTATMLAEADLPLLLRH